MAEPLLLDTNVYTFLTDSRKRRPEWGPIAEGRTLVLSFVTVGEVLHGALSGGWSDRNLAAMESRLRAYPVIPGTFGVAREFAELRRRFHKQMDDNDLWIAACALAQPDPLPLATDDDHFDRIAAEFPLVLVRARRDPLSAA
jgi:predicted nucleic acid-binding protein